MTVVQSEATPFRATADMAMSMMFDLGELEGGFKMPTEMNMTWIFAMDFNVLEGLHQIIKMNIHLGNEMDG